MSAAASVPTAPSAFPARLRSPMARVARPLGAAGAALLGLEEAYRVAARLGDAFVARLPPPQGVPWGNIPAFEVEAGRVQYPIYIITMAFAVGAAALSALVEQALERWVSARVADVWRAAVAVLAIALAFRVSPFAGELAAGTLATLAVTLAAHDERPTMSSGPVSPLTAGALALVAEGVALGWAVYLLFARQQGVLLVVPLVAFALLAAFRAGQVAARPGATRALQLDVLTGAPFLLLPLLGIARDPSGAWVVAAALAGIGLRTAAVHGLFAPGRAHWLLAGVLAPCAIGAIFVIPMAFRELPSIDNHDHEGQHLAWVNAALFGKFLMADASSIYGPLREYFFALWLLVTGPTLEHMRIVHIVCNLAGLALMLAAGWRVSGGRPWLHVMWTWLVVAHSPLVFFVTYRDTFSFGWADLARTGLPALALVCVLEVLTRDAAQAWPPPRAHARAVYLWGVLCGVSILYSHDFGLCAFGAVGLAIVADALLRVRGPIVPRARAAAVNAALWTAGGGTPLLLLIAVYACFGKARLFLHTLVDWAGLLASGAWSGMTYPVTAATFTLRDGILGKTAHDGPVLDFIVPLAIMIAAAVVLGTLAVRRAWTARATLLLTLLLFSLTSFRHALLRSEMYHLKGCGTPTLLLLLAMCTELARHAPYVVSRYVSLPVGRVLVLALVCGWAWYAETPKPFREKLEAVARGDELPSTGPRYVHPDVPRAGDVRAGEDVMSAVRYIRANSTRQDPVLVTYAFLAGGEYAFLLDRVNPTRFDVPHEIVTREHQLEVVRALHETPPKFIVGDYFNLYPSEAVDYIKAKWRRIPAPGAPGLALWQYQPDAPAPAAP